MKTFVASAFILSLTGSAFATEPQTPHAPKAEKGHAPVVLTITQLDAISAGTSIGNQSYTYDANGNLTGWTDQDSDEAGVGGITIYSDLNNTR